MLRAGKSTLLSNVFVSAETSLYIINEFNKLQFKLLMKFSTQTSLKHPQAPEATLHETINEWFYKTN